MVQPRPRQSRPTNDCCPERCHYSPRVVAYVIRVCGLLAEFGEDPGEALSSALEPHQGYEMGRSDVFGPTMEARWILYRHDVTRAIKAGCQTPDEISAWLCPLGGVDRGS